jgi:hypothetical protein
MQVSVHEIRNDEDVLELALPLWCLYDVLDANYVFVPPKMTQQAQFPQQQLSLLLILDRILDFFNSDLGLAAFILCSNNHAVRTLSELLEDIIGRFQVRESLVGTASWGGLPKDEHWLKAVKHCTYLRKVCRTWHRASMLRKCVIRVLPPQASKAEVQVP